MTETNVPNFHEIWNSVPELTAPRTLDAAIEFLNQIDHAIDLDDAKLEVYDVLVAFDLRAARGRRQSQGIEDRARRQCRRRAHNQLRRNEGCLHQRNLNF